MILTARQECHEQKYAPTSPATPSPSSGGSDQSRRPERPFSWRSPNYDNRGFIESQDREAIPLEQRQMPTDLRQRRIQDFMKADEYARRPEGQSERNRAKSCASRHAISSLVNEHTISSEHQSVWSKQLPSTAKYHPDIYTHPSSRPPSTYGPQSKHVIQKSTQPKPSKSLPSSSSPSSPSQADDITPDHSLKLHRPPADLFVRYTKSKGICDPAYPASSRQGKAVRFDDQQHGLSSDEDTEPRCMSHGNKMQFKLLDLPRRCIENSIAHSKRSQMSEADISSYKRHIDRVRRTCKAEDADENAHLQAIRRNFDSSTFLHLSRMSAVTEGVRPMCTLHRLPEDVIMRLASVGWKQSQKSSEEVLQDNEDDEEDEEDEGDEEEYSSEDEGESGEDDSEEQGSGGNEGDSDDDTDTESDEERFFAPIQTESRVGEFRSLRDWIEGDTPRQNEEAEVTKAHILETESASVCDTRSAEARKSKPSCEPISSFDTARNESGHSLVDSPPALPELDSSSTTSSHVPATHDQDADRRDPTLSAHAAIQELPWATADTNTREPEGNYPIASPDPKEPTIPLKDARRVIPVKANPIITTAEHENCKTHMCASDDFGNDQEKLQRGQKLEEGDYHVSFLGTQGEIRAIEVEETYVKQAGGDFGLEKHIHHHHHHHHHHNYHHHYDPAPAPPVDAVQFASTACRDQGTYDRESSDGGEGKTADDVRHLVHQPSLPSPPLTLQSSPQTDSHSAALRHSKDVGGELRYSQNTLTSLLNEQFCSLVSYSFTIFSSNGPERRTTCADEAAPTEHRHPDVSEAIRKKVVFQISQSFKLFIFLSCLPCFAGGVESTAYRACFTF